MKRLTMSPGARGNLAFTEANRPTPLPHEALIRVTAFSMNRGEVNWAAGPESKGRMIGWDFVGVVEEPSVDGSTPPAGTRVVGWRAEMDAWAEYVVSDAGFIAAVPEDVDDATAATLPVAGLTALAALDRGDRLIGNDVLVTGATGGVGHFAVQLSMLAGARTVAQVRHEEQIGFVKELGADEVVVTSDGESLEGRGPFRLIVDGVGGPMFGRLVPLVAKGGCLVSYGVTAGSEASIRLVPDLFGMGGQRSIYGLTLYTEIEHEPSSSGLRRLLQLVRAGRLRTEIGLKRDWSDAPETADELMRRTFSGKAVLTIGD